MAINSLFPRARAAARQPDDSDPAAVRSLNEQYLAAVLASDAGWLADHLAEDAVVVMGDGRRLRKSELVTEVRAGARRFRSLYAVNVSVRAFGAMVQVDADAPWETEDGRRGVSRYLGTWAVLDGRWQLVSAQVTTLPD